MRSSLIDARLRYLTLLALPLGCGGSEQSGVPAGLIVAPMVASAGSSTSKPAGDAGVTDSSSTSTVAHLPLPAEPRQPAGQSNCLRKVDCRAEDDEPQAMSYPAPWEKCPPKTGKNDAQFSVQESKTRREWDPHACCYVEFTGCSKQRTTVVPGRPLKDESGAIVTAAPAHRDDWLADIPTTAPDEERARAWLGEAATEHASVAAFSRISLELLALGAPPDLVAKAHEAAMDEIEHARACYALAARFGIARGPAPLAVPAMGPIDLASFAKSAILDGFANEAAAAQLARDRADAENDPVVRAVLERISSDEERHAAFGLEMARWALVRSGDLAPIREALAALERDPSEIARAIVVPCVRALLASLESPREGDPALAT
jgi:hypothetical protein